MKWDAILFDLDDTLYSRAEAFHRTMRRMAEIHVAPVYDEPVSAIMKKILELDSNRPSGPTVRKERENIFRQFKDEFPRISESSSGLNSWYKDELITQLRPDSAAENIFAQLVREEVPWGIVTNGDDFQLRKIESLNIEIDRERIIMSDEAGWAKPDVRLFDLALGRLGISNRENILMVGDNPVADIQGAKNAGLHSAWMNLGRSWSQSDYKPDIQLDSLSDLLIHLH